MRQETSRSFGAARWLVIAILLSCGTARADGEAAKLIERSEELMLEGKYGDAVAVLEIARAFEPTRGRIYPALARAQAAAGRCDDALATLRAYARLKQHPLNGAATSVVSDCFARARTSAPERPILPPVAAPPAPPPQQPLAAPTAATPTAWPASAPSMPGESGEPVSSSGARVGGVVGLISGALFLALSVGSEITSAHPIPSIPLGASATVLHAIDVPLVAWSGSALRRRTGVPGVLGLRVVGWLFYGLTLADAAVLLALGALNIQPPTGTIAGAGVSGFISSVFISADALATAQQVDARDAAAFRVSPFVNVARTGDQTVALVGLSGRF